MVASTWLIQLDGLHCSHTLELPSHGITAIFGASGSGKTSLLRAIAGIDRVPGNISFNEQCWQYNECQQYLLFTQSNKPVFNIEYQAKYKNDPNAFAALCQKSQTYALRSMVMPKLLNGRYRYSCD